MGQSPISGGVWILPRLSCGSTSVAPAPKDRLRPRAPPRSTRNTATRCEDSAAQAPTAGVVTATTGRNRGGFGWVRLVRNGVRGGFDLGSFLRGNCVFDSARWVFWVRFASFFSRNGWIPAEKGGRGGCRVRQGSLLEGLEAVWVRWLPVVADGANSIGTSGEAVFGSGGSCCERPAVHRSIQERLG